MNFGNEGLLFATMISYFFIYVILALGLNIQYGLAGIPDFTLITFLAFGAYFSGVTGLPHPSPAALQFGQTYILGWGWPFPLTLLAGGVAAGLFGLALGLLTLNRLRSDYFAIVTFSLGFVAFDVISNNNSLFNGQDGIVGIQPPLNNYVHLGLNDYQYFFIIVAAAFMLLAWLVANRIQKSQLGRTLRAIREDQTAAEALGKNAFRFRLTALVIGCFFAGVAGALTIELISAFNPSGFTAPETFVVWAAVLIGGRGNNKGVILGSFLVPTLLIQGITLFFPYSANDASTVAALQYMFIGLLLILILWFRPAGILPERAPRFAKIEGFPAKRSVPAVSAVSPGSRGGGEP